MTIRHNSGRVKCTRQKKMVCTILSVLVSPTVAKQTIHDHQWFVWCGVQVSKFDQPCLAGVIIVVRPRGELCTRKPISIRSRRSVA
ncbi:hypothetical protein C8Q79DRAFT_975859 [Trametes meyenii]|nr:hypothetical protein C8Q79DRAFT_975859 [Trametes meyenii]